MSRLTDSILLNSLLSHVRAMKKGKEYVFSEEVWDDYNKHRRDAGLSEISRDLYRIGFDGIDLLLNGKALFSLADKKRISDINRVWSWNLDTCSQCLLYGLMTGEFERFEKDSCDGKVVEIDGKKYTLSLVKDK